VRHSREDSFISGLFKPCSRNDERIVKYGSSRRSIGKATKDNKAE
jgi:hypothetical protein